MQNSVMSLRSVRRTKSRKRSSPSHALSATTKVIVRVTVPSLVRPAAKNVATVARWDTWARTVPTKHQISAAIAVKRAIVPRSARRRELCSAATAMSMAMHQKSVRSPKTGREWNAPTVTRKGMAKLGAQSH